jgi:uncharacterized Zn finger protein (UPF0148 family)
MIDRPQGPKPSSPARPLVAPAPELLRERCSDCNVPAVSAGDGDLKVCPRCYAVLWQSSTKAEETRRVAEQRKLAAAAAREENLRMRRELQNELPSPPGVNVESEDKN